MPMIGCWTMLVGSSCANRMHIREFGSNLRLGRGEKRKTGPFYFFAKQSSLRSSNRSQIEREMLKLFAFFCHFACWCVPSWSRSELILFYDLKRFFLSQHWQTIVWEIAGYILFRLLKWWQFSGSLGLGF